MEFDVNGMGQCSGASGVKANTLLTDQLSTKLYFVSKYLDWGWWKFKSESDTLNTGGGKCRHLNKSERT